MAGDGSTVTAAEIGKSHDVLGQPLTVEVNKLVDDVETLRVQMEALREYVEYVCGDQVVFSATTLGLTVDDSNAENVETANAIVIQKGGQRFAIAAESELDISALSAGGATVATSGSGVAWVFASTGDTWDVEVDKDAQAYLGALPAWAAYSTATNTLPPTSAFVPVGAILVTEGGSGTFTWGTSSITDETETYVSLNGRPAVLTPMTSFAADADAATLNYSACVVRLGSGVVVSASGKASGETITGSNVADGAVGAWLFYILADDSEISHQLGAAYASLAAARQAVAEHNKNPYLAHAGTFYVENASGANFVPGTTKFDAAGITATFVINRAPGSVAHIPPADLTAGDVTITPS